MSLSGDAPDKAEYTSQIGFTFGAVVDIPLTEDINLSVQPSYTRRGAGLAFDVGEDDPIDSLSLDFNYVALPVTVRFLSAGKTWFASGGLEPAILVDASLKDLDGSTSSDVSDYVNDYDIAMLVGAGAVIPIEPVTLTLELRYSQSILNAGSNAGQVAGVPVRFRSSGFTFTAGVLFGL
jgi:hypothetical protein